MMINRKKAIRALGTVLRREQPDYVVGQPLNEGVLTIGQALGLLPYEAVGANPTASTIRRDKRAVSVERTLVLLPDDVPEPEYMLRRGRM